MNILGDWILIGTVITIVILFWFALNWSIDVLMKAHAEMKQASAGRSSGEAPSPHGERVR